MSPDLNLSFHPWHGHPTCPKAVYFRILSGELDGSLLQTRRHHHARHRSSYRRQLHHVRSTAAHLGAWTWEHDLCTETLTWLPNDAHDRAAFIHQLGIIAQLPGTTRRPRRRYEASLTISGRSAPPVPPRRSSRYGP
jgi:hypothetical protein